MNIHTKKVLARIIGNFGIAFFSPLVGGNVAETLFDLSLTFQQTVIIAFFSAIFVSGLSISKEAVEWSKLWNETK